MKLINLKAISSSIYIYIYISAVLFLTLFIGIFIRIKLYCCNFSFWNDEAALALNFVNNPTYFDMFKPLNFAQSAPPFFLVISKFLLDISGQIDNIVNRDLILRIFPLISGIIALPLFSYTIQKIFKDSCFTLITTAFLAFNKTAINYVQEFKPYSTDLLFSVILFYVFYKYDIKNYSAKKTLLISLLFCIAPWFSYSSVFILSTGFLYLIYEIVKNKYLNRLNLTLLFVPNIINGILFLMHYKLISTKLLKPMVSYWSEVSPSFFTFGNFYSLFNNKINVLMPFLENYGLLILIPAVIILFIKNNKKIAFLTITPIILCIFASFMQRWPFERRLILFLLPFFIIILAQYYHLISKIKKEKIVSLLICIVILTTGITCLTKKDRKKRVYYSGARELLQIIQNEKANMNNVITYTLNGKYYIQPYNTENIIVDDFDENKLESIIKGLPNNEDLWLYIATGKESPLKAGDYIKNNKQYEVLNTWKNEYDNGLVIKFRKK